MFPPVSLGSNDMCDINSLYTKLYLQDLHRLAAARSRPFPGARRRRGEAPAVAALAPLLRRLLSGRHLRHEPAWARPGRR
jgi:hypothetical protein